MRHERLAKKTYGTLQEWAAMGADWRDTRCRARIQEDEPDALEIYLWVRIYYYAAVGGVLLGAFALGVAVGVLVYKEIL